MGKTKNPRRVFARHQFFRNSFLEKIGAMPKKSPEIIDLTLLSDNDDDIFVPQVYTQNNTHNETATTTVKRSIIEKTTFKKKSKKKELHDQFLNELEKLEKDITCSICADHYKKPIMIRNEKPNNSQIYCGDCIWEWSKMQNKQERIAKDPLTNVPIEDCEIIPLPSIMNSIIENAKNIVKKYNK